ncbi:hypothetical protein N9N28_04025 [Rubripirellula amarantea]|nr:hypothetical protein [Rubripirellula amarantea]
MPRFVSPITLIAACLVTSALLPTSVTAQQPGWSPVIVATGEYRDQIKSMPIEQRPYRPLHFYGNTVRRNYYRGTDASQRVQRQQGMTIVNQSLQGGVVLESAPVQSHGSSVRSVPATPSYSANRASVTYPSFPQSSGYSPAPRVIYPSAQPLTTPVYPMSSTPNYVPVSPASPAIGW